MIGVAIDMERQLIERRIEREATRFMLLKLEPDPRVVEHFEYETVEKAARVREALRLALLKTIDTLNARLAQLQQWT